MDMALEHVQFLEYQGSGKTVFIECSDKPALINFYTKFDFVKFDRRQSKTQPGETLVQMIKYFDKPTPAQIQRWSQS